MINIPTFLEEKIAIHHLISHKSERITNIHLSDSSAQVCESNELLTPLGGIRLMAMAQADLTAGAMEPEERCLVCQAHSHQTSLRNFKPRFLGG